MTPQQLTAAAVPVRISGKEYKISLLSDKDFAELDATIKEEIMDIGYRYAKRIADPDERSFYLQAAIKASASSGWGTQEGYKFLNSPKGQSILTYFGVRKNHPRLTQQEFTEVFLDEKHLADNMMASIRKFNELNTDAEDTDKEPADADSKSDQG